MVIQNKGKPPRGNRYLACANAQRSVGCANKRLWPIVKVERAVLQQLRRTALPPIPGGDPAAHDDVAILEARLASTAARRERLLDMVEDGDEGAIARVKSLSKAIAELREAIAAAKADATLAAAMPSYLEQLAILRQLQETLETATGENLTLVRTRLAQTLRTNMIRIDFGPHRVVARMRVEHIRHRVGISQGSQFPDGAPVTVFDDTPTVLTENDMAEYAAEASEDRARADREMLGVAQALKLRSPVPQ
jgi:hypothetical protein